MDFYIIILLLLISIWFAKKDYDNGRVLWAMFWSMLVGWDLHALAILL